MASSPALTPTAAATQGRRLAVAVLVAILAVVLVSVGWAVWRLNGVAEVAQIGTPAEIPDGHLLVEGIEHVAPSELGAPLPDGSHAVEVKVTLTADEGAGLAVSTDELVIEGTGVPEPIPPSRVVRMSVPSGGTAPLTLVYAVPDASTDLVLVLPGGAEVSAEHDDHPGDRADNPAN
jgi:hypothetical protein